MPTPATWPPQPSPQPRPEFHGVDPNRAARPRTIATLTQRGAAGVIDLLMVGITVIPVSLVVIGIVTLVIPADEFTHAAMVESSIVGAVHVLVLGLLWVAYVGGLTSRSGAHRGQTLGHQALGIVITARATGAPITPSQAWRRAGWQAVLLAGLTAVARLTEVIPDVYPYGSLAGGLGFCLMACVVLLAALGGSERRMLHDRCARTVVTTLGYGPPQPTSPTARTRVLALGTCLFVFGSIAAWCVVENADRVETQAKLEEARRTLKQPETAQLLRDLKLVEADLASCMQRRAAADCRAELPARFPKLEFVKSDGFDTRSEADIRANRGKFSAWENPDDGSVRVYAFGPGGRIWLAWVFDGGRTAPTDRGCLEAKADTCRGLAVWPGWND